MPATDDRDQPAEDFALVLCEHGMQRMSARVLSAFVFTERQSLTQGDLVEELDAGAGSVSTAIKQLTATGMLEQVPVRGSRREHRRLRADAWATLFTNHNQALVAMLAATERGIAWTEAGGPARERLEGMRDFYEFVLAELPALLDRWHARQAETAEASDATDTAADTVADEGQP